MTRASGQRDEVRDMWSGTGELTLVTWARVPLAQAEDTCLFAFRPEDGGDEIIAVRVGRPEGAGHRPTIALHRFDRVADVVGSLAGLGPLQTEVCRLSKAGGGVLLLSSRPERWLAGLTDEIVAMLPAASP